MQRREGTQGRRSRTANQQECKVGEKWEECLWAGEGRTEAPPGDGTISKYTEARPGCTAFGGWGSPAA